MVNTVNYSALSQEFNSHDDKFYVTEIDGRKYIITAQFSLCGRDDTYEVQLREMFSADYFGPGVRKQITGNQKVTLLPDPRY